MLNAENTIHICPHPTLMNVVMHMPTSDPLNVVYEQKFNDFNDLSHNMGMSHVKHTPITDPLNLQDGHQFNDFNNLPHKMKFEKASLESEAQVTNRGASYKDSWMMENSNACSMFNNNSSARENSFMGDNNNTIVISHPDKTMNSTSPNSLDIYHVIHCLTFPPNMGESTYSNTGYISTPG
jgi:hypothetical protein